MLSNTIKKWLIIPISSAILVVATTTMVNSLPIAPGFPEPLNLSGVSGGPNNSGDCGFISNEPSQVLEVKDAIPYLRITAQVASAGTATMLVDGAMGRFCILPNNAAGGKLELSGYLTGGVYKIYLGDRAAGQSYPYNLSISQKQ